MRRLIVSLCMVLVVALTVAHPLDISNIADAHPGMVATDGKYTYYVNDVNADMIMMTSVIRDNGTVLLGQVMTWSGRTDTFYSVLWALSLFEGSSEYITREIMYKEAEDSELYSGVMYMPVGVQVDTASYYPTITYIYELKSGVDESWNTIMVWDMDGTMIYSGIIGEL